jgi:hypothetical protein
VLLLVVGAARARCRLAPVQVRTLVITGVALAAPGALSIVVVYPEAHYVTAPLLFASAVAVAGFSSPRRDAAR